jgi:uncharacterized protein DUF3175
MSDARNHARDTTANSLAERLRSIECPLGQAPDCPLEAYGKSAHNQGTEHLNRCFRPRFEISSGRSTVLNSERASEHDNKKTKGTQMGGRGDAKKRCHGFGMWRDKPSEIFEALGRAQRPPKIVSVPFRSAMSMLTFYLNRGDKNLSTARKRKLEAAKVTARGIWAEAALRSPNGSGIGPRALPFSILTRHRPLLMRGPRLRRSCG